MPNITEMQLKALTVENDRQQLTDGDNLLGKVRATRAGVVVHFEYRYRFGSRIRAVSCGTWPAINLKKIRLARDAYRVEVNNGVDPLERKYGERLKAQADQASLIVAEKARLAACADKQARLTVREAFAHWEKQKLSNHKDGGAFVRRAYQKDVFPLIGDMAIADVKKAHVAALLDAVLARGVARMTNVVLSLLRQLFRYALSRDWIETDPTAVLSKKDFGGRETERDRVISTEEIQELGRKMPVANLQKSTEAAIWIMLSTCCRVGELSKARWCEVDTDARRWLIPAANAKNGREHMVALSDFAIEQFEVLRSLQTSPEWIFPARVGDPHSDVHLDDKAITKQVRDRQRRKPIKGRSKHSDALILANGEWTPHDLRRTGATLMGELGVDSDIIERCLNHIEQNKMARIYQRQTREGEMAAAWRLLGAHIALLKRGDTKVVSIRRRIRNIV